MNGRRITDVACPMIAPPGRVAATRLRRGTCNPPLIVCAHQVNELTGADGSAGEEPAGTKEAGPSGPSSESWRRRGISWRERQAMEKARLEELGEGEDC